MKLCSPSCSRYLKHLGYNLDNSRAGRVLIKLIEDIAIGDGGLADAFIAHHDDFKVKIWGNFHLHLILLLIFDIVVVDITLFLV